MRKANKVFIVIGLGLLLATIVVLSSCRSGVTANSPKPGVSVRGWEWSIIKSPLTGRCYEMATINPIGYTSYAGMAEIPCAEYEEYLGK